MPESLGDPPETPNSLSAANGNIENTESIKNTIVLPDKEAQTIPNDQERGETKHSLHLNQMLTYNQVPPQEYDAPEWFLKQNVRLRANLVDRDANILWTEQRSPSAQSDTDRQNRQQSGEKDQVKPASLEGSPSDSKQASGGKDTTSNAEICEADSADDVSETSSVHSPAKSDKINGTELTDGQKQQTRYRYEASHKLYLELHDMAAGALVTNQNGDLASSKSFILLRSESMGNLDFADAMLVYLAKEMEADMISFDLGDLEDAAWEFDAQEAALHDKTGEDKRDKHSSTQEHSDRKNEKTETKKGKKPNRKSLFGLTEFYFGPHSPDDFNETAEGDEHDDARKRNRKAMSTILDTPRSKHRQSQSEAIRDLQISNKDVPPIFVHIRDANHILELGKGLGCISGFRSRIEERRTSRQRIILFVSITTSRSPFKEDLEGPGCHCPECQSEGISYMEKRFRRELFVDAESILNVQASNISQDKKTLEAKQRRASYARKVRRSLRQHLPWKSPTRSSDLLAPYPVWDFADLEEIAAVLDHANLSNENAQRAARQICGRTLSSSRLDVDDIRAVLTRIHGDHKDTSEHHQSFDALLKSVRNSCDKHEQLLLSCVVDPRQLQTTYDDVIIDHETKETVKQLISLSNLEAKSAIHPLLQQIRIKGALFYGLPGTGKTHLSRAIAKESGANMLAVDAADIQNKYVGETEKSIKAIFSLCTKLHPCILFIDEADSLFRRRGSDDRTWERNAITLFLQQMDGLTTTEKSPFVIVASNRPSDLDEAFLRRLPQKVLFSLPSEECREKILRLFLKEEDMDFSITIDEVVKDTQGFSGADLRNLCGQAALAWAIDQVKPHHQDTQGSDTSKSKLLLNAQHFAKALRRTRPSVSRQMQQSIDDFQGGAFGEDRRMEVKRPALGNHRLLDQRIRV